MRLCKPDKPTSCHLRCSKRWRGHQSRVAFCGRPAGNKRLGPRVFIHDYLVGSGATVRSYLPLSVAAISVSVSLCNNFVIHSFLTVCFTPTVLSTLTLCLLILCVILMWVRTFRVDVYLRMSEWTLLGFLSCYTYAYRCHTDNCSRATGYDCVFLLSFNVL